MENPMVRLPENLQAATQALSENLCAAEPFVRYNRAQARLDGDRQAKELLNQLSTTQAKIRTMQSNGGLAQTDIDTLRALQNEVQHNRTIMDYANAQQTAVSYLREINQEISQLLGVDFAALARQSTC